MYHRVKLAEQHGERPTRTPHRVKERAGMYGRFEGQVAFVTSVGSGVGAAVTSALLDADADAVDTDLNEDGLAQLDAYCDAFVGELPKAATGNSPDGNCEPSTSRTPIPVPATTPIQVTP
jgi:hypothetical protein